MKTTGAARTDTGAVIISRCGGYTAGHGLGQYQGNAVNTNDALKEKQRDLVMNIHE